MPRGKEDGDEKAGPSAVKKEEEEASTAPLPEKVRRPLPCLTARTAVSKAPPRASLASAARCRTGEALRSCSPRGDAAPCQCVGPAGMQVVLTAVHQLSP